MINKRACLFYQLSDFASLLPLSSRRGFGFQGVGWDGRLSVASYPENS